VSPIVIWEGDVFGLLSTLAEILSTYATRFFNGRGTARDVDLAANLLRIVMALQNLALRGERLLRLVEDLLADDEASEGPTECIEKAEEVVRLLNGQTRGLMELDEILSASQPLLATIDASLYPELALLLDVKSGLVARWRQQVSQSRFSTTTLFFLPSEGIRGLMQTGRDAGGSRSLGFVSAVADHLHGVRRHEIRDIRSLPGAETPAARARAEHRLREEIAAARADLARATDMCARLQTGMEESLGAEAMAGLRRKLLPTDPR
jgi:hypothetical protein